MPVVALTIVVLTLSPSESRADDPLFENPPVEKVNFDRLAQSYSQSVRPLVVKYCTRCHSTEDKEGELDLERFAAFDHVRRDPSAWQKVAGMLSSGEMPPEESPQPASGEQKELLDWTRQYLDAEARANAGDPGPVVLRRLNNAEYTYTIQDLTGAALEPAREFPADGAAGEGFTNAGAALSMSPALVQKYFDAAKQIADHAVLLPDGFRFSTGETRRDWTNELIREIRSIYYQHTVARGDVRALDRWSVGDPRSITDADGRVELTPYFDALIRHRARLSRAANASDSAASFPADVAKIAAEEHLSAKYLTHLATALVGKRTEESALLDALRQRIETASAADVGSDAASDSSEGSGLGESPAAIQRRAHAAEIAAKVRMWEDRLWKYNNVGHFGMVRPWREPVSPLVTAERFRIKIARPAQGESNLNVRLVAHAVGGDGQGAGRSANRNPHVVWRQLRIERPGAPAIAVRDLRGVAIGFERTRKTAIGQTSKYLAAAYAARAAAENAEERGTDAADEDSTSKGDREESEKDSRDDAQLLARLAAEHQVDPIVLRAWLDYLGIGLAGETKVGELFPQSIKGLGGYDFVRAWVLPGVGDLSVVSNASDQKVNIPGDLNPHRVAVHPRPERWVAAGWRSPIAGRVQIRPHVQHAHNACGNGVSWSVELKRGPQSRTLAAGDLDRGKGTDDGPLADVAVRAGDLISLTIGPRNADHSCDLTEIDLTIVEQPADGSKGEPRRWSLAADCADDIDAGNPHADRFGNARVWHFFSGKIDGSASEPKAIAPGTLVAEWLDADSADQARRLGERIERLLVEPNGGGDVREADVQLREQLVSSNGPLWTRVDFAALARAAAPGELAASQVGIDPSRFGRRPDGTDVAADELFVAAPDAIDIRVPADLFDGAEFVCEGAIEPSTGDAAVVQLQVSLVPVAASNADATTPEAEPAHRSSRQSLLFPGTPILVGGDAARARMERAFADFRRLFPSNMCYPRIVPVDEVVTLMLFHREDEPLQRLMLDETEAAKLNRLWDELYFVSREAMVSVTAFEQLMEFATQDSDPSKFEPLREPINQRAESLRQQMMRAEPSHVAALVEFASQAYRRPLSERESRGVRELYDSLRDQDLPHEEAFRLTMARILTSPAFLYRLESSGDEPEETEAENKSDAESTTADRETNESVPSFASTARPVSDWEMASRLSYFFWSSMPDAKLRNAASEGKLRPTESLRAELERMRRDDKVRRMAIEFACQWMHLRDFDQLDEKSDEKFPEFKSLRGDMYEESIRFFADLIQNDGSVLSILDADFTFVNEPLAKFYSVDEKFRAASPASINESDAATTSDWRRIDDVRSSRRGGVLGMAAMLAKQSGASRTSPILRGNWVSETLLGERLPRPPKDVPQLPESAPADLTERQLTERHSSVPACAKCHVRVDPYGFALENFDAIGRFRTADAAGHSIDSQTELMDGTSIDGAAGLREYLRDVRRDDFLRQFCRKLVGYALGRSVQLSDEPLLGRMMAKLKQNDHRISAAIEELVLSDQFRKIRTHSAADAGVAEP